MSEPTKVKESAGERMSETNALIRRHVRESDSIPSEMGLAKMREHSVRQVEELISHARKLESDRDRLRERVAELTDALRWILQVDRGSRAFESALAAARVILAKERP